MHNPASILADWRRLADSGVNNRAAAARLALSEAELLSCGCGSIATRLVPDAGSLLASIRRLGRCKFVVRNDFAVLERPGEIARLDPDGARLQASGPTFQLSIDTGRTASAFALVETGARGVKRSLQLFDRAGVTQLKLVFRSSTSDTAFETEVGALRHSRQSCGETVQPALRESPDASAMARIGEGALAGFLGEARLLGVALEWTVRNDSASLQAIEPVRRVKRSDRAPWINVLDPELDLHLFEARIGRIRVARHSAQCGALHWHADDGSPAFSVSAGSGFDRLAAAAGAQTHCSGQAGGDNVS